MRWLLPAVYCAALASACSALVDPGSLVIKCEVMPGRSSKDPCLVAGMHCVASECRPCKGARETCNGEDDDCDGVVDNGQDDDRDGFTWCGGLQRELADCDDKDASIHPAGVIGPDGSRAPAPREVCDGKDNDCDSKVDEGKECADLPSCVTNGCPEGRVCDDKTGVCLVPRPVGSGCTSDAECAGGFCVRPLSYGTLLRDSRCASACCSDMDCVDGSVCAVLDSGARMCLPANIVARASKPPGERCLVGLECASGVCDRSFCVARCFSETVCRNYTCYLTPATVTTLPRLWVCGDAQGFQANGGACSALLDSCRSGLCNEHSQCAKPCGRNADCAAEEVCSYAVRRGSALFAQPSAVPSCEPRASATTTDALCCTNADCADGQLCVPKAVDSDLYVMACK